VLDQLALGAQAQYQVNGSSVTSTSNSRSITLAPGLTVKLQGQTASGAAATSINVTRNTAAISNALGSLVTAYNSAVTALSQNRGANNGALTGNSVVTSLSQMLEQLSSYSTGNSGVSSLTALGLTFDSSGVLSFDSSTFAAATSGNTDALLSFLGDPTTGGFLKSATDLLNGVEDPTSGMLKTEEKSAQDQITRQNNLISDEQTRIDNLTQSLQSQMAAADALVASLQQQVTYITNMFSAMQTASNSMR
jgi:flagellar hook-associated protein 2